MVDELRSASGAEIFPEIPAPKNPEYMHMGVEICVSSARSLDSAAGKSGAALRRHSHSRAALSR